MTLDHFWKWFNSKLYGVYILIIIFSSLLACLRQSHYIAQAGLELPILLAEHPSSHSRPPSDPCLLKHVDCPYSPHSSSSPAHGISGLGKCARQLIPQAQTQGRTSLSCLLVSEVSVHGCCWPHHLSLLVRKDITAGRNIRAEKQSILPHGIRRHWGTTGRGQGKMQS